MCAHVKDHFHALQVECYCMWMALGWCGQRQTGLSSFSCLVSVVVCQYANSHTRIHTHTLKFTWPRRDLFDTTIPKSCAEIPIPPDHQGPAEVGWHQRQALCFHDFSPPLSLSVSPVVRFVRESHYFNTRLTVTTLNTSTTQHEENKGSPTISILLRVLGLRMCGIKLLLSLVNTRNTNNRFVFLLSTSESKSQG